jgi:hypothetical protein
MKIINSTIRAIIERVTEIEYYGINLFVFEYIDEKGRPHDMRIQNWECDDISKQFTDEELINIKDLLKEYLEVYFSMR